MISKFLKPHRWWRHWTWQPHIIRCRKTVAMKL